jgi:hypothetical protein
MTKHEERQKLDEWKRRQHERGMHLSKNGSQSSTGMNAGGLSPYNEFHQRVDEEYRRREDEITKRNE